MQRLPEGEELLPILETDEGKVTPENLSISDFDRRLPPSNVFSVRRFMMRAMQGREFTISRVGYEATVLEQLYHMELEDEKGLEMLKAELKFLQEELKLWEDEDG